MGCTNGGFDIAKYAKKEAYFSATTGVKMSVNGSPQEMKIFRVLLVLFCIFGAEPTHAHSPYYGQSEQLQMNEGGSLAIKLLYGDGIFASDPVRAIIVDSDLRVRAVSPLALSLHIICDRQENERPCVVYDDLTSLVYELDPEKWAIGPVIEDQGRPLGGAYPEEMGIDFGFKQRPATYFEIIRFEGDKIRSNPLLAGFTFLWWSLIALLLAPLFWRINRNMGTTRVGTVGAIGLLFVTVVWWDWEPFSLYFVGFFALLGAAISIVVTRPRRMAN